MKTVWLYLLPFSVNHDNDEPFWRFFLLFLPAFIEKRVLDSTGNNFHLISKIVFFIQNYSWLRSFWAMKSKNRIKSEKIERAMLVVTLDS